VPEKVWDSLVCLIKPSGINFCVLLDMQMQSVAQNGWHVTVTTRGTCVDGELRTACDGTEYFKLRVVGLADNCNRDGGVRRGWVEDTVYNTMGVRRTFLGMALAEH